MLNTESTKLRPWERLKSVNVIDLTQMQGRFTTAEALIQADQDWEVHKVRLTTLPEVLCPLDDKVDPDQTKRLEAYGVVNPQMAMTMRFDFARDEQGKKTDQVINRSYLGTVGDGYGVVQNDEYAAFFDEALGKNAAIITSAGTLGRFGARVFMVATLPDMLELVPGEPVERHILLTTTHDGSGPVEVMFMAWDKKLDVMCYTPGGRKRIRHTKNADKRIRDAKKVLCDSADYWEKARRACEYLNSQRASERRLNDFLEAMFPDKEEKDPDTGEITYSTSHQMLARRAEIAEIYGSADYALPQTDYGIFKAVQIYVDHYRRRSQRKKGNDTHASQWEVSVFGPGGDFRDKAFKWLRKPR
jgi:phage/plasmid-like protein (TIGR03299 family)